ncbi:type VI secretion system Vgr family protein [Chondromyces apiculatus]|uniref:VgrG protein n=1 Tax=Chondromyces apiculatus DSM 436 TaxID=1192034 RepID=A0A017T098_9BACT|nr:type VI secretion system tip protein TssI/VgrG [Chondromyces apiculatus]EYF02664.1 VgrG protein [Chondromyces apiculatus DSM 436]
MVASAVGSFVSEMLKPNLELKVDSGDVLDVRSFKIRERFSNLFEVVITAMSSNPEIDFEAVLGRPALFRVHRNRLVASADRFWSGVCNRIQQVASVVEEEGLSTYELTLVPRLWFLTQRRNYRIFQQLSDLEIVVKLLGEWGVEHELRVDQGAYKKRKYRVQYGESDLSFVSRLLEDAGITYYFEQVGEETKMVLNDAPQDNPPRGPIQFIERPMVDKDEDFVTEVRIQQQTRPGRYTIFDHDYRRPASYKLHGTSTSGNAIEQLMERFHYVPGAFLFRTDGREPTPSADDRGPARHDESEASRIARQRLEAKRASAKSVTMKVNAIDVRPGSVFTIADHPRRELEKRLLVVDAVYEGTSFGAWSHQVETRSAESPYRPPLITPKPKADGCESATVVGPAGEEIHVDEFGRVRVQFHWDREGKMDQDSSCWIHVSQPWGGAGFGGMNLPRIGQEVIVDFLSADPDRPVIVGRVYTNLQKVPYALPQNKTQSGIRSNSSPSNGGYSELMFEDRAGGELVRFQAQKDFTGLVKNDARMNIQNDRTHNVGNNDTESVFKDQTIRIGKDRKVRVKNEQRHSVGKDIFVQSVDGKTTHKSKDTVLTWSDKAIVLAAGANSYIKIELDKIIIQSGNVYINPGPSPITAPEQPEITDAQEIRGFIGRP